MQPKSKTAEQQACVRRGFTIVELLMVVGIIATLITITVSAVSGSLRNGRSQRSQALCTLVGQGIATYYAQKDEWPVKSIADRDPNADMYGDKSSQNEKVAYVFTTDEVKETVKKLVEMTKNGNPVMDVSGLYVSESSGESGKAYGMDFMSAVKGTKRKPEGIRLSNMYFGYPEKNKGYFRCFKMLYFPATDTVKVMKQRDED